MVVVIGKVVGGLDSLKGCDAPPLLIVGVASGGKRLVLLGGQSSRVSCCVFE